MREKRKDGARGLFRLTGKVRPSNEQPPFMNTPLPMKVIEATTAKEERENFRQTSDAEVTELLSRARRDLAFSEPLSSAKL